MNRTMLIVDDLEMNRSVLRLMFENEFDVIEAGSAMEAQIMLEACAGNIDVMLLDIFMPERDGLDFLKENRHKPFLEQVPVVVITGSEHTEDQVRAFESGANDFITKPFMPEIVISRVENAIIAMDRANTMFSSKQSFDVNPDLDPLTGMYMKLTTEVLIRNELMDKERGLHALMAIDIDNFQWVIEHQGQITGDQTIRIISNQIISSFRAGDIVGRMEGDLFVVFLANIPNEEFARKKANQLAYLLKYKPNLTLPANVSVSIGLAFANRSLTTYSDLYEQAMTALRQAKAAGKARMCEYGRSEEMQEIEDHRPTLLLVSRNRNVCSSILGNCGAEYAIHECGSTSSIPDIPESKRQKAVLAFIDASDETDGGEKFWEQVLTENTWLAKIPIVAVCREGDMNQFRYALRTEIVDIITRPIELNTLKRKMDTLVKKEESIICEE